MKGIQLEFYTGRNKRHHNQPLWEWVLRAACSQGVRGATVFMGTLGFGHHRRIEPPNFFQLADQPVWITMILTEEEADQFIATLRQESVQDLFYVKQPVEFETLGRTND
jgi:PII-like signaling protein